MNLLKVSLSLTAWLQNVSKRSPEFFRYQVQMCKVSSHLLAIRPWSRPSWQTWPSQTPGQTWWTLVGSGSLEEHYLFNTAFQYGGCITKVASGHISQHRNVRACVCVLRVCVIYFSLMNDAECTCLGHFFLSEGSANTCLGFFCTKDEKSSHWPLEDLALDIGIPDLAFPWAVQFLRLVWVHKSQSAWRISPNRMLLILLLQGLHKILMLLHCCCNLLVLRFDLLPKKQVMWSTPPCLRTDATGHEVLSTKTRSHRQFQKLESLIIEILWKLQSSM